MYVIIFVFKYLFTHSLQNQSQVQNITTRKQSQNTASSTANVNEAIQT